LKALVTGASGFIGSYITEILLKNSYEVSIFDHHIYNKCLSDEIIDKTTVFEGDILDEEFVSKAMSGCDIVFHFAALVGVDAYAKYKILTMETEGAGLKIICSQAMKKGCKKIIYPSSSAVYGNIARQGMIKESDEAAPVSNYAVAKRYNEIYLESQFEENGLQSICLRIFNVYGPRQDERLVIPRLIKKALLNVDLEIYGDGEQTRDFLYIDDLVFAAMYSAENINGHEILNIGSGVEYSINDLARKIIAITDSSSNIKYKKLPVQRNSFEVRSCMGDSRKLQKLTGFIPSTLLDIGLINTYQHIMNSKNL